jgi:pimeloyl-ACP methyl ester carboxylesterase
MIARTFLNSLCFCCLALFANAQQLQKKQQLLDGIPLSYTEAGSGKETLILLHGLGGNKQHWMRNLPGLSQHYRVLALDLPGYGDSKLQALPEGNLLLYFSKAVVALMDSLAIQKAHLVGHSMGGQLATLLALEHPERVRTLTLAAPAGIETFTPQEAAGLKAYAATAYPHKQSKEQIRQAWALNFHRQPAEVEALIQERLQLNESGYYPTYARVLEGGVSGMLEAPVAQRLREIKAPVLILFGAEDRLIPNRHLHPTLTTQAVAQQAQTAIPNSKLVLLPAAGHLLQFEQSQAFNKALLQFLKHKPAIKN